MSMCDKCRNFLPPGFVMDVNPETQEPLKGNLCIFCIKNTKYIDYGNGKRATKKEVIKEYDIFLKKMKENSHVLKESMVKEAKEKLKQH